MAAAAVAGCKGASEEQKPNIIVILADDLGFSDLGCFGGEINTPVLDGLAQDGVRFTQMYNSARSCPSRAMILTGLYPHQVGVGDMVGKGPEWPIGYRGFRSDNNVTIAEALRENGYYTAMAGKWHLGRTRPVDRGFEDYYGLLGGFDSFWNPNVYRRLSESGHQREYAEGEFYTTDVITDYAIDFVREGARRDQPMFLYLAYNAPHFPLQAPKERTDEYMETYLEGWDAIREKRWKRIQDMGLMKNDPVMSPRGEVPGSNFINEPHPIPAWAELTADEQTDLARRMAIFAAMVDIMDENIGRLIDALRETGQLDNTLILFMSDNGACAEWHEYGFDYGTGVRYHIHTGEELDGMGLPGTYHHYGTGWANVGCTPLYLYKHFAHEGGISTPGIMWWGDKVKKKGSIDHQACHFTDIMATCIDVSGSDYPLGFEDREVLPMEGVSLAPMAKGKKIRKRPIYAEHEGNRMVRDGKWKLVASHYTGHEWELYDIDADRTEQNNLAAKYPDRVEKMEKMYFEWADRCNVLPYPQLVRDYGNRKMKIFREK